MKTTNLQISKKLKEIGFEAENDFYWGKWNEGLPELVHKSEIMPALIEKVPAYDLETLLEALPKKITYQDLPIGYKVYFTKYDKFTPSVNFHVADGQWYIGYFSGFIPVTESWREKNESLADTAGRLLIKLHEVGIINFNK